MFAAGDSSYSPYPPLHANHRLTGAHGERFIKTGGVATMLSCDDRDNYGRGLRHYSTDASSTSQLNSGTGTSRMRANAARKDPSTAAQAAALFQAGDDLSLTADKRVAYEDVRRRLDFYYGMVKRQLMRYQDEASGLFRTESAHGTSAHVRDNIYAAAALWALSRAYQKIDNDDGRTTELAQCAVKTMRRILLIWMNETSRLEQFKSNQAPENCLHCKFNVLTLAPVEEKNYHHLQVDVVGLFLIYLCQMIESGLKIIYTRDEVNLVQNLVFYIERAYRTPDFGIWERGTKYNDGEPELHASSIGAAKAALECVNGFNVFGERGSSWSIMYIDVDAHSRNRTTLETMLPRESSSKNTDASLLCTLSYPVFAMHKPGVFKRTFEKVQRKLMGKYGFRRFLRDGYGTALWDTARDPQSYYAAGEIHNFETIESQWPVFFAFLIIDGVFHQDFTQVEHYQKLLEPLLRESYEGDIIMPRYYYVPEEFIDAERAQPGSQPRLPSDEDPEGENKIFILGQAVFLLSQLLVEGLLHPNELDPLRRYLPATQRHQKNSRYSSFCGTTAQDLAVQVCLISESPRLQRLLGTYGIATQTPLQIEPVQLWSPNDLVNVYSRLGINEALGLKGRPKRPFGPLSTCKLYRVCGVTVISYPLLFDVSDFYLSYDTSVLMDDIKSSLAFVARRWRLHGRPTMCVLIREENFKGPKATEVLHMLASFRHGEINGVRVKVGTLQNFIASSCIEHLDFADSFDVKTTIFPLKDRTINMKKHSLVDAGATVSSPVVDTFRTFEKSAAAILKPHQPKNQLPTSLQRSARHPSTDFTEQQIHEFCHKDINDVMHALNNAASLNGQAQLLTIIHKRHGPRFVITSAAPPALTVLQHMEKIIRIAAVGDNWHVVRQCSAVLHKVVPSLAPSLTSVLVRGKIITVGIFGKPECVIGKPITPNDLVHQIYATCEPYDPAAACLQQELLLIVGKLIDSYPKLFDGILKIRIGWLIQAINLYISFTRAGVDNNVSSGELSIDCQAPAMVQELVVEILCLPFQQLGQQTRLEAAGGVGLANTLQGSLTYLAHLTPYQRRQIDGCLGRVPKVFYDCVWAILHHAQLGIKIAGIILPQQPTITEMSLTELQFALKVETILDKISFPAYRQIVVELLLIINLILERNPECQFITLLDTDQLVVRALEKFISNDEKVAQSMPISSAKLAASVAEVKDAHAELGGKGDENVHSQTVSSQRSVHEPPMQHYTDQSSLFSEQHWARFYDQTAAVTGNFLAAAVAEKLLEEMRLQPLTLAKLTTDQCALS